MSRKPTTLWKPDDAEAERSYIPCAASLCTNLVSKQGDRCHEHKTKTHQIDRSPANHLHF